MTFGKLRLARRAETCDDGWSIYRLKLHCLICCSLFRVQCYCGEDSPFGGRGGYL